MYRLFSDFPLALPGAGLLLLRVVLSACLLLEGATRTAGAIDATLAQAGGLAYGLALVGLGILVALGFLTPIVHVMVAVVESVSALSGVAPLAGGHWQIVLLQIGIALALAMIGPGAYSIDSRLFGRHEIVIRPRATASAQGARTSPRK